MVRSKTGSEQLSGISQILTQKLGKNIPDGSKRAQPNPCLSAKRKTEALLIWEASGGYSWRPGVEAPGASIRRDRGAHGLKVIRTNPRDLPRPHREHRYRGVWSDGKTPSRRACSNRRATKGGQRPVVHCFLRLENEVRAARCCAPQVCSRALAPSRLPAKSLMAHEV
jgi:hypothetical protein